jgi:uncharacterized membrane protein
MAEIVAERPVRPIAIVRHPIYSMLLPVPVVCFLGVLLADLIYLCSGGNLIWLDFSSWLLLVELATGAIAAIVLLADFIRSAGMRSGTGWAHLVLFYLAPAPVSRRCSAAALLSASMAAGIATS